MNKKRNNDSTYAESEESADELSFDSESETTTDQTNTEMAVILAVRKNSSNQKEYLVQWVDFMLSWETIDAFSNCMDLITNMSPKLKQLEKEIDKNFSVKSNHEKKKKLL
eukprot:TRINITY_DN13822_c0_g1_i1.p1 TRINITY_DN13822_c0_g1~~TRINITY_DN13822_c0_g1_i1.p1  ORF type:complete len:125 (+),score=22.51 TRINITY_DN13822_c0_g1_i1:46-375(+)